MDKESQVRAFSSTHSNRMNRRLSIIVFRCFIWTRLILTFFFSFFLVHAVWIDLEVKQTHPRMLLIRWRLYPLLVETQIQDQRGFYLGGRDQTIIKERSAVRYQKQLTLHAWFHWNSSSSRLAFFRAFDLERSYSWRLLGECPTGPGLRPTDTLYIAMMYKDVICGYFLNEYTLDLTPPYSFLFQPT